MFVRERERGREEKLRDFWILIKQTQTYLFLKYFFPKNTFFFSLIKNCQTRRIKIEHRFFFLFQMN